MVQLRITIVLTTTVAAERKFQLGRNERGKVAWTVPTIVGQTMYVRDKTTLFALDLG